MKHKMIMLHYFHDNKNFKQVQGSISAEQLEKIITDTKYKVLSAEIWIEKFKNKTLEENEVCLSFDDGLKEQVEVAIPILNKYSLKGIFNINTGSFEDKNDLEVNRYYRNYYFDSVEEFYSEFFKKLEENEEYKKIAQSIDFNSFLEGYDFYTYEDRKFRYFRDVVLKEKYDILMKDMRKNLNSKEILKKCCFNKEDIKMLSEEGHIIGLHTHSHPVTLSNLNYKEQELEFSKNKEILEEIIKKQIKIVAYPCGEYNIETLKLMKKLGVEIGMVTNTTSIKDNNLLIGREDICKIIREYSC